MICTLFQEDQEFDEFTEFDWQTGFLKKTSSENWEKHLANPDIKTTKILSGERLESSTTRSFRATTSANHTRFPRRIYFQITRKCQLNCSYCFIKADSKGEHVPFSDIKQIAKFMGDNGLMEVRLTGGEPTLHPDFPRIVEEFHKNQVYVSIASNGLWPQSTKDFLFNIKTPIWLICSIDGNKEQHNHYRPDSYDKIKNNLIELRQRNPLTRIRLTTVLTRHNYKELESLAVFCGEVSAESITLIPLRPQVRDENVKQDMLSSSEFKSVIEKMVKLKEKYKINFTTTLETDYKSSIFKDPVFSKRSSCAAGREGLNLDYNYQTKDYLMYGCSYSPASDLEAPEELKKPFLAGKFTIDNLNQFYDIWNTDEVWEIFRDLSLKSHKCSACSYYERHLCTGSCPIQNINYDNISISKPVLEQLKHEMKATGEWYCYQSILDE